MFLLSNLHKNILLFFVVTKFIFSAGLVAANTNSIKYDSVIFYYERFDRVGELEKRNVYNKFVNSLPETINGLNDFYQFINSRNELIENDSLKIQLEDIFERILGNIKYAKDTFEIYDKMIELLKTKKITCLTMHSKPINTYLNYSISNYFSFFDHLQTKSSKRQKGFFLFMLGRCTYMGVFDGEIPPYSQLKETHLDLYKQIEYLIEKYPPEWMP